MKEGMGKEDALRERYLVGCESMFRYLLLARFACTA